MLNLNLGLSIFLTTSFLIVCVIFAKFFWNPILKAIQNREEMITSEIENTKKALYDAQRLKNEHEELLIKTRHEAEKIIDESRRSAERIKGDIIETAKMETVWIREQAKLAGEAEKNKVMENLRQDIAALTIQATEKILGRIVTAEENEKLVMKTVESVVER